MWFTVATAANGGGGIATDFGKDGVRTGRLSCSCESALKMGSEHKVIASQLFKSITPLNNYRGVVANGLISRIPPYERSLSALNQSATLVAKVCQML
jgi:hypothetical protein